MKFGLDYASAAPNPAVLKKNSVKFVCRYVSTPGNPKNLTVQEALGLHTLGIGRVIVFETTGKTWRGGHAQGVIDARAAAAQLTTLGLPKAPVYFAVDEDVQGADLPTVAAYIEGAASEIGWARTGVYGSYAVVAYVAAKKACRYFWQTYAWSGTPTNWHGAAHLRQYRNAEKFAGIECDFDSAMTADYGQADPSVPVAVRRHALRVWVLGQRKLGRSWTWLKQQPKWKLWRRLGGK